MLRIENLTYCIKNKKILNSINLHVQQGSLHACLGPNGSGKSTLLRNICNIWKAKQGKIYIQNQNIKNISRKKISQLVTLVPQDTHIAFPITVQELVLLGRSPHLHRFQAHTEDDFQITMKSMQKVGIEHLAKKLATEISGGERQLSWLACALTTQAPLLLLDEPTASLDIHHTLQIFQILQYLKQQGLTIFVVLHELQYAYNYFDTVTLLHHGKIHATGKPENILTQTNIQTIFQVQAECQTTETNKKLFHFWYFYDIII